MNIKAVSEIRGYGKYYVIAFTRIGVLSSATWSGEELIARLDGFRYDKTYDMWFYPGDPTGYDVRVCEDP